MESSAERLLASEDQLGECPLWDEREAVLWWIDIRGRALKRYDGKQVTVTPVAEPPGSIALRRGGGLIVALASGVYALQAAQTKLVVRPPQHEQDLRFNDGRCDRAGRFWVGTLAEPDFPPRGVLYRIEPDGRASAMRSGVRVPNSLAWSPDGRTMYFADSPRHKIWACDYDPASGNVGRERVFAGPHPGFPDGSCVDADGCVWNAEWGASRVVRYTPRGEVDRVVRVPANNPSCCCFGGARLDTLYITSADRAGLFALAPGVSGLAESRFG
jgi:sugar lactone lactonase YvrE